MKLNTTQLALQKMFKSEIADNELTIRFDGFKDKEMRLIKQENELTAIISTIHNRRQTLANRLSLEDEKPDIIESALQELKTSVKDRDEAYRHLSTVQKELRDTQHLIDKYVVASDNKRFLWWKVLKAAKIIEDSDYKAFEEKCGNHHF